MSELILSIQSHVAYGHVGNDAAMFPLQRLGAEVIAIHTVQFSNHTGYGAWTGEVFGATMIADLVRGVEARGVLGLCDGILHLTPLDTGPGGDGDPGQFEDLGGRVPGRKSECRVGTQ